MKNRTEQAVRRFFEQHPDLQPIKQSIFMLCGILLDTYAAGGKLLVCGNGGSCADSDHIVGELMKGFLLKRPLEDSLKDRFRALFGNEGHEVAVKLQRGLPAISLNAHTALNSAFGNDVDADLIYAQQVAAYAKPEDFVLGISTSGNAKNVWYALMAAKAKEVKCAALSGKGGGKLLQIADCCIIAPAQETYRIQEYHLMLYHFVCAYVESELFDS